MWLKKSLLTKLLLGMLVCAMIPLSVSIIISYRTTTSSVQSQIADINRQAMDSSTYYLQRYLDNLDQITLSFYFDPVMMGYLRSPSPPDYAERLYISNQVYTISKERPEFRAVRFSSAHTGEVYTNSAFLRLGEGYTSGTGSTPENDPEGWGETYGYEVVSMNGERLLAFHKPIIDYPRTTLLGVLTMYIGSDELEQLVRSGAASEGEQVFLMIRKDRQLLYSSDGSVTSEQEAQAAAAAGSGARGALRAEWKGQPGVMVHVSNDYKGMPLTLVKFIPSAVMNEAADRSLRQSLVIPLIMTALVLICSFLLSYMFMSPIKRLVRSIAQVQSGNFDMQPIPARQDELGVLEHRFQAMIRGLDDLMNREYRHRLELTTARLKMLQAQINPHFLYNSLQSIGTLALRQGAHDVNDKIAELGFILRYSMDISTETVPLKKEIEHIEHYMSLQLGRFKNRLSYTMSCAPDALHIPVPKMILQPLVENSIIHGIERGHGSGSIHISIELHQELIIRVMDNGKGMTRETIESIRREYGGRHRTAGKETGIGLINVLERLRLRYEGGFGWDIRSTPYEETVIQLCIPQEYLWEEALSSGKREEESA
ncbi:cache domain-containing sensor histidine kinase [Paenibacillus lemnae]|uniref:Sensor histidine kinase n=1 Tax=Paenibacillus lemnae TaxID=1330551 RepID=A0A848M295_PAELE|nr:sensor histidine kinase [Paenibacillus lemnae]NMO94360.1 sensor histidine kinase [Paenibacillus lemnae]